MRPYYIVLLLACVMLAASCEHTDAVLDSGVPLRFSQDAASTKADATLIDNDAVAYIPSGTAFSMYGWVGNAVGEPDYMNNEYVHNDGGSESGSFSYSPQKYWPNDGGELSFVAAWPYGAPGLDFSSDEDGPRFSYAVGESASTQTDLLVSIPVTLSCPEDGTVGLEFRHVLSRVSCAVSVDAAFGNNGTLAVIDGVSLVNVLSNGVYDPEGGAWASQDIPSDYVCTFGGTRSDIFLFIPQERGSIQFRVDYTVHILDGEGRSISHSSHTSYAAPTGAAQPFWEPGMKYFYQLVLKETHLEVTCSVAPWDVEEKTYDYSTEVTIADDGLFSWTSGTYASASASTWKVITAFNTDLTGSFCIETPEGAVWYAILETLSGSADAFRFVDAEGRLSASAYGAVGERATIRIRQTDLYPAETNSAKLSFVVRSAGRNIPVEAIVDAQGHSWTIIQNANN